LHGKLEEALEKDNETKTTPPQAGAMECRIMKASLQVGSLPSNKDKSQA
jgi:hypothetical protein